MSTSIITNQFLYGKGVFTTVAFSGFGPSFWEKHWKRLETDAAKLGIDLSGYAQQTVRASVIRTIASSKFVKGRVRITFADESSSQLWCEENKPQTLFSIVVGKERTRSRQFKLTISPYLANSTSPLAGVKSCNYLEPLMSHDEAKSRGFVEAIRLNERGEVTSACMANVFWLKGGRLFTPSLKTGCLAGTTREFVLENLECEEVEANVDAIREADEIFLTSAGIGVVQVAEFEGKKLENIDHPIKKILPF